MPMWLIPERLKITILDGKKTSITGFLMPTLYVSPQYLFLAHQVVGSYI